VISRIKKLFGITLVLALALGVGLYFLTAPLDRRTRAIFAGANKVEVFRIEYNEKPSPPETMLIDGYPVIAKGQDQNEEFAAKLATLLEERNLYTNWRPMCFMPGVVFRVWKGEKAVDVVICFKCNNFYLGSPKDRVMENKWFGGSPLRYRLVGLAKEAFPEDKDIQALKDE
jgi:hypothetical protein